jgi:hypothetical protein
MRRMALAAIVFALAAACSPPSAAPADPAPNGAYAGSSGAGRVEAAVFTLDPHAVPGNWSFDRSCGLYDLVFSDDGGAQYFDYADESHVVTRLGTWTAAANNRIVLTLRMADANGAPSGEAETFNFDVTDPVTDDLIGRFGPAAGEARNITAKRCPQEDRE